MKAKQINQVEWKKVELSKLLDYQQPTKYIIKNIILPEEESDSVPVLTANKVFILGYTNEKEGIYSNTPAIIFDDFTTDKKFVDFKFKVKSSAMKILKPKSRDIDLKFVFYVMSMIKFNFTTHKRYYLSAYQNEKVPVPFKEGRPDLETQEKIVAILEKAEGLKEKRRRIIEYLDDYLKSVFYEMFGNLEKNNKKWDLKRLSDICYFENGDRGKNYPSDHTKQNTGIPFVNAGCFEDGNIIYEELNYITSDQFSRLGSGKFKNGDFLFCLRGSVGKFAISKKMEGAIASSLVIIRPKNVEQNYLSYYFRSSLCKSLIKKYDTSSSQPNLSANNVKSFVVPFPPIELQQKFASIVENVEKLKEKQKQSKEKIDEMFNSLMQKAFNGELVK